MRRAFEIGGLVAAAILIAFGAVAIFMGINGHSTVVSSIKQEKIVGSADMTPAAIAQSAKDAKLPASISLPTCNVAGKAVNNGDRARCFAQYMRMHTLEATGGYTYSQMGRYQAKPDTPKRELAIGGGTSNSTWAVLANGRPVDNGLRSLWVTETALTTALNTSYMADRLSVFGLVMGIALLLSGIGFGVLAVGGALRGQEAAFKFFGARAPETSGRPHAPAV